MHHIPRRTRIARSFIAVIVAAVAAGCDGTSTGPGSDPLEGLRAANLADSVGGGIPQPLSPQGSGSVTGTVVAPSAPGAGNDSLATATRIAGVTVRIYPIIDYDAPASPRLGAVVATLTTDANGRFTTPVLPSTAFGHVVTFTPPSGSNYAAVWVTANFWTDSSLWPWWVTLPRMP